MLQVYPVLCRADVMNNYAYVITDGTTTAVIDPSEADPVIAFCDKQNLRPQFILNTHHHFDHVGGNLELSQKYQAKIACNQADMIRITGATLALKTEETAFLGSLKADIIDVSAHTKGHILYYFKDDKILFTGDTLFNLCIGGLFEGSAEMMFNALKKIKALPDDVLFYPGHEYTLGGASFAYQYNNGNTDIKTYLKRAKAHLEKGLPVAPVSLGEEKHCNPYLEAETLKEFINL